MSRQQLKSSEGPSWQDVSLFIQELHKVHGLTAFFTISSSGANYAGCASVELKLIAPVLVGPAKCWERTLRGEFPCHQHRTMEGLLYKLLHQADAMAAHELYVQQTFA